MPDFLDRLKQPTEDGQKLLDWMNGMIREADEMKNVMALNAMPGYMKHFFANVTKLKSISPTDWLEQYENTSVDLAWRDMTHLEEQAAQAQMTEDTAEGVSTLEAALEQLKEELSEQQKTNKKEIKALKSANTKLTNKLAASLQEDDAEAEEEEETDDVDDETETEDETADAETEDDVDDSDSDEDVGDKEA